MIFLESVWGCLRDCPTKCGAWGNRPQNMPSNVLNGLIIEAKEVGVKGIQLYGRGDICDYPIGELQDLSGCEISVTDISYHLAEILKAKGATVFVRIDNPLNVTQIPLKMDGYFTVESPASIFFETLVACRSLRPFAIKSLDGYGANQFGGYDLRASGFQPPYNKPTRIMSYTIPSRECRIPLITHFHNEIYYLQCISGKQEYKKYINMEAVISGNKCSECFRFPKQKRIYYYE